MSAFKVHQDFGWRSFSATSNDPQSRLRLRIYSVWRAMCKIDTVLVFMLLLVGNLLCILGSRCSLELTGGVDDFPPDS